ncbi:MAG: leucine-rich repeat domain-containing protein [Muribaculaceae bacterium]|nr:leucine-rich repeat domain-containing protein [Muribaculaceae bacterium]
MRNILLMMATTLLPMCAMAQQEHSLTVNVEAPGTLASYIAEDSRMNITALTVKGSINGTDLGLIRTMAGNGTDGYATEGKLESLDLSGARLVRGGDVYYNDPQGYDAYSQTFDDVICSNSFWECKSLVSVILPEGITRISDDAFSVCTNLKSINIPSTVTKLGSAFYHCFSLESITIPEGIKKIDDLTFSTCRSLQSITIPESVTEIGAAVFRDCDALTEVVIPNAVTSIGNYAFQWCDNLTNVTLGEGLTSLADGVFYGCTQMASITALNPTPSYCGTDAFGQIDKEACILYVPAESVEAYSNANGYKDFMHIQPITASSIDSNLAGDKHEVARYSIDGRQLSQPTQGINIVRYSDGTTTKVVIE